MQVYLRNSVGFESERKTRESCECSKVSATPTGCLAPCFVADYKVSQVTKGMACLAGMS